MNLKQKIYQMFILGTDGGEYKQALKQGLGGVIFFTHDIQTPTQFKNLITECKSNALIAPFLSIDQEGGRVERTENIHAGKKYLSAKYANEKGLTFLKNQTTEIAEELKKYGINLNYAPCIDVNTNPNNPIIGERAFSSETEEVIKSEKIVSEIYRKHGIIPCVKHFPGHGDANSDSHLSLPVINKSLLEMEKTHIKPFKNAIENGIEMIMVAHLHCTCFEKETIPTSLSKNTLSYLRNQLGFNGVAISDDMVMKGCELGVKQLPKEQDAPTLNTNNHFMMLAVIMGIKAGLDMFIFRNSTPEIINMIESITQKAEYDNELKENIEKSYERITYLKKNLYFFN